MSVITEVQTKPCPTCGCLAWENGERWHWCDDPEFEDSDPDLDDNELHADVSSGLGRRKNADI